MTGRNRTGPGAANLSAVFGLAAAAGSEAQQLALRRRMGPLRLTASEREACTDQLAEQYALGRLDDAELGGRLDLLHRAVTHGDLAPVFDGLPMPRFDAQGPVQTGRWRWLVFAGAAWMAVPFILLGLMFMVFGREVVAAVFGLPALVWVALFWRWAAGRSGANRPPRR